jgi:cyclic beta-1,2-glucan synthetase
MQPVSLKTPVPPRQTFDADAVRELAARWATLTNGVYTLRTNGLGVGHSQWQKLAVTRWTDSTVAELDGFHIYLRDLDSQEVWSAGYLPTRVTPSEYSFSAGSDSATISRVDHGVRCTLNIGVVDDLPVEIRHYRIENLSDDRRRLDVTSYLEWVLGSPEADACHPAFSKLFVETRFDADRNAILAQRRPRSSQDAPLWGFHSVLVDPSRAASGEIQFETNRARFIGRGRDLEHPAAMQAGAQLTGDVGAVLDPIASLRVPISLEPGEQTDIAFLLGVASSEDDARCKLDSFGDMSSVLALITNAQSGNGEARRGSADQPSAVDTNGEQLRFHPAHRTSTQKPTNGAANGFHTPSVHDVPAVAFRSTAASESLLFDNGYGGFTVDGREYVIRILPDEHHGQQRPPLPWANVIANEKIGFIVTESGAGYTWSGNSRLNRLTTWHNDPITDPHSEAMWIRDEETGEYWSPLPGPTPAPAEYSVRHGFGYTRFDHESHGLKQETTVFVPPDEPVKVTHFRLTNHSGHTRRLSFSYYVAWALGGLASETAGQVSTSYDPNARLVWANNPHRMHYGDGSTFSTLRVDGQVADQDVSFTCDGGAFIGADGSLRAPHSLSLGRPLNCSVLQAEIPCAAWRVTVELSPDATFECSHLLGETQDRQSALNIVHRFSDSDIVRKSLDDAKAFWSDLLTSVTIETPDREIDLMVNGWLLYQNLSCRMWGRSANYQPGGAFGFRDQLQDSAAFVYQRPDITRTQILRHASQQFLEGDVLHWWHPDTGFGVRTRFSDDLLWLPYITSEYVRKTGDHAILDDLTSFIEAPPIEPGHQEAYLRPNVASESASVYEHCCRALDRGLTRGRNGLPLIGCGDWNDGFSRVGSAGQGESVWLGFFIDHILENFLPICEQRGDADRIAKYTAYREILREALNDAGWDGQWYRRAYYDNGQPMGSQSSDECQVDAIAQAWAVLSGVAPNDRIELAMDAVESRLIDDEAGIIRLLTPAFNSTPNDPGYIKGYLPGIRENGGQYTHGVLWVVRAMAELGRGTRATELLRMLTPVWHASSKERADIYQTEPYVVAADVYGEPPHVGRGGWTWYTGSAGWMYRVAIESIFGFTTENSDTLVINPSIAASWPECRLNYRLPDGETRYEITIENPSGHEHGVQAASMDDKPGLIANGAARLPLLRDGQVHRVVVRL